MSINEQFDSIYSANSHIAKKSLVLGLNATEIIVAFPWKFLREMVQCGSELPNADYLNKSLFGVLSDWSKYYKESTQEIVHIAQGYFEVMYEAHDELNRFIQDGMKYENKKMPDEAWETTFSGTMATTRKVTEALKPERKRLVL